MLSEASCAHRSVNSTAYGTLKLALKLSISLPSPKKYVTYLVQRTSKNRKFEKLFFSLRRLFFLSKTKGEDMPIPISVTGQLMNKKRKEKNRPVCGQTK